MDSCVKLHACVQKASDEGAPSPVIHVCMEYFGFDVRNGLESKTGGQRMESRLWSDS